MKIENTKKQPPRILTDVGLSMFVNTIKLRDLPLPITEMTIEKLLWHFNMPVWGKDGTDDWNCTPWEVIRKEEGTIEHQKRTEESDTIYPIIVTEKNSQYVILDGIHRLVKTYVSGGKTIKAKIIPSKYLSRDEFQTQFPNA